MNIVVEQHFLHFKESIQMPAHISATWFT